MSEIIVKTYKAETGAREVDDLTIVFSEPVPFIETLQWEAMYKEDYQKQADILITHILKCAPGGLVDAIFVALAKHKAGVLIVPHKD